MKKSLVPTYAVASLLVLFLSLAVVPASLAVDAETCEKECLAQFESNLKQLSAQTKGAPPAKQKLQADFQVKVDDLNKCATKCNREYPPVNNPK